MAENKKGFLLYANYIGTINQLPDDVAGRLFKHIFAYVNDLNPKSDELLLNVVFEPIKNHLKEDLEKYILGKHDKSLSGRIGNLKRWNKDLYDDFAVDKLTLQEAEIIAQNRKVSRCDDSPSQTVANIAVIDIVKDKVIVNAKEIVSNKKDVYISDFTNPPPDSLKIDYEKLKLFFNDNAGNMSKIKIMTDERKKSISFLIKKYSKEKFKEVIEKAKVSDFLQGGNGRTVNLNYFQTRKTADHLRISQHNHTQQIHIHLHDQI